MSLLIGIAIVGGIVVVIAIARAILDGIDDLDDDDQDIGGSGL